MLDDLRNSAEQSFQEPEIQEEDQQTPAGRSKKFKKGFLGMTAAQRFIIALMILFLTCLGGVLCLLVTGSLYIP